VPPPSSWRITSILPPRSGRSACRPLQIVSGHMHNRSRLSARSRGWMRLPRVTLVGINCGITNVRVPVERSRMLTFLVRTKRFLRELRSGAPAGRQPSTSRTSSQAEILAKSPIGSIRQLFFDVLIDDKKRWSLRVIRRIVSEPTPPSAAVIIASGPPMSSVLGAVLAGRRLGIPVIVDLRGPIYMETSRGAPDHSFELQWGAALWRDMSCGARRTSHHVTFAPYKASAPLSGDRRSHQFVRGIGGVSCAQSSDEAALRTLLGDVYRRHVVQGTLRAPSPRDIWEYSRAAQNQRFIAVIEKASCGGADRPRSAVGC
jgi:hypothetical protein